VVGEDDPRSAEEVPNLYTDIGSTEGILLKMQCATHFLLFERNHRTVHDAFAEFLTKGTVNGRRGEMTVDRNGNYLPVPETVVYANAGERIEAQLYKPAGSGPFPLVIHVHSGPDTAAWGPVPRVFWVTLDTPRWFRQFAVRRSIPLSGSRGCSVQPVTWFRRSNI
jgi:hypothetical protein